MPLITYSFYKAVSLLSCPTLALLISILRQRSYWFNSVATNLFTSFIARIQQGICLLVLLALLLLLPAYNIYDFATLITPSSSSSILFSSLSNLIIIQYFCLTLKLLFLNLLSIEESCHFVLLYAVSSCCLLLASKRQLLVLLTKYYYFNKFCEQLSALNCAFQNGLQPLNNIANSSLLILYALLYTMPPILYKLLVSYSSISILLESLVSAQQQQRV